MRPLLPLLALCACTADPGTVEAGGLSVTLLVPGDVDPLDGADTVEVALYDKNDVLLEWVEVDAGADVSLGELDHYGIVSVEVTARAGNQVLSAARTGPVWVSEEQTTTVAAYFLPVNQAVRLESDGSFAADEFAARIDHTTMATPDGRVLILGGRRPSSSTVWPSTEWWDPELGFTGEGPEMPTARHSMSEVTIGDGELLLSGGHASTGSGADPEDASFLVSLDGTDITAVDSLNQARAGHCTAAARPAVVAAMGGTDNEEAISMELLKRETDGEFGWSLVTMADLVTGEVTGCVGDGEGRVVTVGESDDAWGVLDLSEDADVDPDESFRELSDTQSSLEGALMVPRPNGEVWIGGGASSGRIISTGRDVDPQARRMEGAASLDTPRAWGHWRWWDVDEEILAIAGGFADDLRSEPVDTVELLNLASGDTLTVTLEVNSPRVEVVRGQALLVTGGIDLQVGMPAGSYLIVPWWD